MTRVVLDAGAFVALERGDVRMRARLIAARKLGADIVTTSPVVGQVWRSSRQVLLARALHATRIEAPDEVAARRAGDLLAKTRMKDVVDALVVGLARDGDTIVTSDVDDVRVLANAARVDATIVRA
jgi:predicted nucleic acid-binding protein